MFTGLVEEIGTVKKLWRERDGWWLAVRAERVMPDLAVSHSIAVNGACLTVTDLSEAAFTVGLAPETVRRTNLGDLHPGEGVNLERALQANGRVGGHFVHGHVDGTGVIREMRPEKDSLWFTVETRPNLLRYIVPKGFVAVDGVSLTVVEVFPDAFTFMLIAYSQEHIVLPRKTSGTHVNLEVDILGKYVEQFLRGATDAVRND
ncbi:MAG: riboflavin synthase [Anaerolineales bacterium]|nr:riboflavin synthase [Anaerolineales bacterium]